jgi:hypothetical protein
MAARLLQDILHDQIGTEARYSFAGHNGRALTTPFPTSQR